MDVQTLINEVTGRAEKIANQGQEVATIGFDTLKAANGIVLESVQTIVKTNTDAATALFGEAKTSFEKATKDGVQAVIANPVSYLPAKTPAVDAFNSTVKTLNEAGTELVKTFEGGYQSIVTTLSGEPAAITTAKKAAKKTEATVKAATKTVKAAAKKATA